MKYARHLHTVRYLKPVQIYGRVLRRIYIPGPRAGAAPPRRVPPGPWVLPASRCPSMTGPSAFLLLNRAGAVRDAADWRDPARQRLWLYNLHYFDDLTADGFRDRAAWHRALVDRWVRENPPGIGVGWEPYPLSLRVANWVKWALCGGALSGDAVASLATQARHLERRVEHHIQGNHLLANAKALACAGLFFEGREAERWLAAGWRLYRRQLREQILADGGHFELSPMYHSLILEDLLDMLNLHRASGVPIPGGALTGELVSSMRRWLKTMTHPDGQIAFFNDAAIGVAASPAEIEAYAARLALPAVPEPADGLTRLPASGYARLQRGAAVAIVDIGRIGPDHIPGHAHADTLSFELSLHGRRLVVNTGVSLYEAGDERARQRGTAAHSTVIVDGADSSEVWGAFRVARRARPFGVACADEGPLGLVATAGHDGFRRLAGDVLHRRTWRLTDRNLTVTDDVLGDRRNAVAIYHLHPDVQGVVPGPAAGAVRLALCRQPIRVAFAAPYALVAEDEYHASFGQTAPAFRLEVPVRPESREVRIAWE
ncbi:MAG: alginate lyase family protein [Chthonomonadales bacterium]|nr:alginate lyase family protein [Chthonomonadales bacterium]